MIENLLYLGKTMTKCNSEKNDYGYHKWIETDTRRGDTLERSDAIFSLQRCEYCGECREVEYKREN